MSRGTFRLARARPRNARNTTALVIDNQYSFVTCPEIWTASQSNEYRYCSILHQLARDPGNYAWGALNGLTQPQIVGGDPATYMFTDRTNLERFYNIFAYAKVLSITAQIEWLGSTDTYLAQGTLAAQAVGPDEITMSSLQFNKHGTSLRYKMMHERFQRMTTDGNEARALAPANMLGWNQLPVLYHPDQRHLDSGRGDVGGSNLAQPGICKIVRFTPEKRFQSVRWKPLSRADKIASLFDIRKVVSQGWDKDQRTGGLWLGQDNWINRTASTDAFNDGRMSSVNTCDFFRITYRVRWKLFRRVASGQPVPVPP